MIKKRHFTTLRQGSRLGAMIVCPIQLNEGMTDKNRLVISVPKVCGKAVRRNRLKRVFKNALAESLNSLPEGRGLWIRLLRQHKLNSKIVRVDWQPSIKFCLESLNSHQLS